MSELKPGLYAVFETSLGKITCRLFPEHAPKTVENFVALANGTEYGLSTGIYTADLEHGRRLADQIHSGLVHIGDQTVADDPAVAAAHARGLFHVVSTAPQPL